jgi:hypothetical protein
MVGMGVRFENPPHFKLVFFDVLDHFLSRCRGGSARLWVVVQNRVNDGAGCANALVDDVSDGPGGFVEDAVDDGLLAGGGHYKAF